MFMVTFEERDQLLRPIAESGQEAVGSMGDDTPMAVLSRQVRHVTDYFRQQFAQVTNPPIDPLRESIVMSLKPVWVVSRTYSNKALNMLIVSSSLARFYQIQKCSKFVALNVRVMRRLILI